MAMAISVPHYTVDDLERFPEDGNRYELLDGVLLVTPMANTAHQVIANRLQVLLTNALGDDAHVVGGGAVVRPPKTQLQPDILVFSAEFAPTTHWRKIRGHWLAIEILSPSSRVYDRDFKRDAYFALGVQQVWLVDPWNLRVEVSLRRGAVKRVASVVRWRAPSGTTVKCELAKIFAGLQ